VDDWETRGGVATLTSGEIRAVAFLPKYKAEPAGTVGEVEPDEEFVSEATDAFVRGIASDALMAEWARQYGPRLLERR
jgi:hypothetical protein